MDLLIILLLIIVNGLFAMAEIAIVSARKSKLQHMANEGDLRAKKALELANNPNRFLSTVQIGITFVGIFAGAFGSKFFAQPVSGVFEQVPVVGQYSDTIALFIVVSVITYLSLVIGELVPKRIALTNPEKIAALVAMPTQTLSFLSKPLVDVLSTTTDWILRVLGVKAAVEMPITEEEVKMLIKEGARVGIFNLAERDIVERTFRLADQRVDMLMTSRKKIAWLDAEDSDAGLRKKLSHSSYSYLPVCRGKLDKVIGVVRTKELLTHFLESNSFDVHTLMHKPIFLPESMNALKVLELFKKSGIHVALAVDEYGNITGLISITDILEALVGDIPTIDEIEEKAFIQRNDGSWLVNGLVMIDEFKEQFQAQKLPDEKSGQFHTIGGFVMHRLGRVPVPGDTLDLGSMH
ncbi:MAG: hemolysin family protein, partial [Patescibacteria group bacterium]